MRITAAALLLPALVSAADLPFGAQIKSLWSKVSPHLPDYASPYVPNIAKPAGHPIRAKGIVHLNATNWAGHLDAHATQPWLVLVTGGNQTCGTFNQSCANVDSAWATASASAKTDSRAPNLGYVDCEKNRLLCATWGATPGAVWWIEPEVRTTKVADTEAARVTAKEAEVEGATPLNSIQTVTRDIYVVALNKTTVAPSDITSLYRRAEYKTRGALLDHEELLSRHPYNSKLAQTGLNIPVGYVYFILGMIPGWTTIMILSFTARMFMQRQQKPKETPQEKAAREHQEKYQPNGKVKGPAPGDATGK